jgi:EpsI family protein
MRTTLIACLALTLVVAGCGHGSKSPDFNKLPNRLGDWEGQNQPISKELLAATGADVFVNRIYQNGNGPSSQILTHLAVFSDWEKGASRHPVKCLKDDGWKMVSQNNHSLSTGQDREIQVHLSEWEKNYKTILVLFWYQMGDRIALTSAELDQIRSELGDQAASSPLVQVQLQITKSHLKGDDDVLKEFAGKIAKWIEKPVYH